VKQLYAKCDKTKNILTTNKKSKIIAMSILKNNLRLSGSSVQSDGRSTNSKVSNRVCATFLAGLILFGGGAKAQNVLVNPGAETGNLTGWNVSNTGYIYVVSTNSLQGGAGSLNRLAHSGKYTFQLFDTTANSAIIYQDFAAVAGSQWSASCYAICYASNYFNGGASAHLQVVFYDVSNNVVVSTNSSSGTAGVYGSDFLDPTDWSGMGAYWTIVPPPAVDATGWVFLTPTNLYAPDPAYAPDRATEAYFEVPISPITTNLTAPPGTAFVRYQLEFDNTGTGGGDVYWDDCVLEKLVGSDPDITDPPVSVTTYAGLSASFTVGAIRVVKQEVLTYQWQKNGTNLPPDGGVNDIAGSTTSAILSFTNCQAADAGQFTVVVSDIPTPGVTNSIRSVPVTLTVLTLTCLQKVNALGPNAGFENAPVWGPWEPFNGCYFASAANVYGASTTPVNVYDGTTVALVGANGNRDNGFHHAFPAAPGTIWKAGGWAYISSTNDFIAGNTCRIQIWFKDADGNTVPGTPTYESFKIYGLAYTNADMQYTNIDTSSPNFGQVGYHAQLPRDQWVYLTVSNVVNNAGIRLGDDLPYNTLPGGVFMVPTNTTPPVAQINFQVYEYCPVAADNPNPPYPGSASDAVYWDDMQLIQVVPVTNLTASVSGNNINLSFSAGAGLDYSVLYKTNLTDATWSVLANNITDLCTNVTVTVTDTLTAHSRFYRVQVQ
jgi:hypothetical protein